MNAPAPDAPPLDWAEFYVVELKWCVFPLQSRSKLPLTATGFHAASRDPLQICKWWQEHPYAGIGIPAGANGLVIVDFDPRHGGKESYQRLLKEGGPWPETARVRTGGADGGRHFYFRSDELWTFRTILPGCDVRAGGSYVCAPPSQHPETGRRYEWEVLPT